MSIRVTLSLKGANARGPESINPTIMILTHEEAELRISSCPLAALGRTLLTRGRQNDITEPIAIKTSVLSLGVQLGGERRDAGRNTSDDIKTHELTISLRGLGITSR